MLAAVPDLDTLVVPVGGGGLISGIATAAKALQARDPLFGVESSAYPSMHQRAARHRRSSAGGDTIAEGIAVKDAGRLDPVASSASWSTKCWWSRRTTSSRRSCC